MEPVSTRPPASDTPADVRLEEIRDEMTASLSRLEVTQRELSAREQAFEEAQSAFVTAPDIDFAYNTLRIIPSAAGIQT